MTTATESRTEVRCPVCGRLQMIVVGIGTGVIERKCDKCNEVIVIDLADHNLAPASKSC